MPQPHITDETYKGLTPDEQAKYGPQKQIFEDGKWTNCGYYPYHEAESFNKRIVYYLKPVEAQQSEGVVIKQKADDIFGKEPCAPKVHYTVGFQDGSEWRAEQYTARITALQQEVERLKEERAKTRDALFHALREETVLGYSYCRYFVDKVLPPTK